MDLGNETILGSLARTESSGDFQAENQEMGAGGMPGHFGRLQFGNARLQDAERAGVLPAGTTPQQFMADPALQQRVESWHLNDMRDRAVSMGLDQYIGQNVGGVPITMDSILAMGHLGGMGGAQRYLESGGRRNPADVYGTSLRDYALTHGGSQPQARIGTRNGQTNTQTTGVGMNDTPQQPSGDLSRNQRMMLGFAALRDAGAALQGQNTNFFADTMGGIQQQAAGQGPDGTPSAIQTLQMRAEMAGIAPGTPEYQQFMRYGGSVTQPEPPEDPAAVRELLRRAELSGLVPGTPEYQQFMRYGGTGPSSFNALDLSARAAGFVPLSEGGDGSYENYIRTRGAAYQAEAQVAGRAAGEQDVQVQSLERGLPVLRDFVQDLREVGDVADYRYLDVAAANLARQRGEPLPEGAIARQRFTAMVDNQILPLLKATFGAAFTAEEGNRLRATLGNETLSPAEKNAQLDAFIEAKEREIRALGGQVPDTPASGGGAVIQYDAEGNRRP